MALWIPAAIRTTDPPGACRPCTSPQRLLCPDPITVIGGCGTCAQRPLLAISYLGTLRCWSTADGHCNPNACCPWMTFDPWTGLRLGHWSSSIVIPVYLDCPSGAQATTVRATTFTTTLQHSVTTGTGTVCGTTQVATLTVFDDGSYTLGG
jgi:hypothetical protein